MPERPMDQPQIQRSEEHEGVVLSEVMLTTRVTYPEVMFMDLINQIADQYVEAGLRKFSVVKILRVTADILESQKGEE